MNLFWVIWCGGFAALDFYNYEKSGDKFQLVCAIIMIALMAFELTKLVNQ